MQSELDLVIQRGVESVVNAGEGDQQVGSFSRDQRLEAEARAAASRNRARRRESAAAAVAALRVDEITKSLSSKGVDVNKKAAGPSLKASETRAKGGSLIEKLVASGAVTRDQLNDLQRELEALGFSQNTRAESKSHKANPKVKKSKKSKS